VEARAYLFLMVIGLPELIENARARVAPGREAASQNEMMRAFSHVRLSGKRTLSRHRRMTESDP